MAKPHEVADYYNAWNEQYRSVYGEIIQAFRPSNTLQLLQYTSQSMGLKDGMKLIDAGCGFAGPSRFFAGQFDLQIDAVTISAAQAEEARKKVAEQNMQQKIVVHEGDYHQLHELFSAEMYDGIFFLESLGHSNDVPAAVRSSWPLLKYGGFIYIKDFFFKQTNDIDFNKRVQEVVKKVNEDYCYNVMALDELIKQLRQCGFVIEFIRPPKFADDIAIRKEFEVKNGIDTFGGHPEFYYAEWLEIKCIKFRN